MSILLLTESSSPNTPSSGKASFFLDSQVNILAQKNDAGVYKLLGPHFNSSVAAQGAGFSSDTYVTNSDLLIPSFGVQAKSRIIWRLSASKSAAGTATPAYAIRIGSARTTSDTARLTLTGPAQTAIADVGTLWVMVTVRTVAASGVIVGTAWWDHRGTAASTTVGGVGFANDGSGHVEATSAGFDNTALGGSYIGLSIDGGASAAWTVTQVLVDGIW